MHQTQQELDPSEQKHDYDTNPTIQSPPTFLNKFFFFNNMVMLYHYIIDLRRETLYRYNDNFKPMLQTTRILQKFLRSKQEHESLKIGSEIFRMQKRTIITMVVLSIVVGLTSLVPVYFQNLLVEQLIDGSGNYYSLAVIVIVMFVRFNILNYTLDLSNAIAINIKLYLQNTFMRVIFYINKDRFPQLKNRVKYLDTQLIGEALFYVPYFITSAVIVIGCLVFMFLQINQYAWIAVGSFVFFIGIVVITGQIAYWQMRKSSKRVAERQKFQKQSIVSRMRTAFQPMSQYVYQLLIIEKTIETRSNFKINLLYIFGQTMCQAFIVVVNIILYALVHQQVLANSPVYFAVLFITTAFLPLRYMVYGYFTMVRGYEAYQQIKEELNTITVSSIQDLRTFSSLDHETHVFAKNLGDCFQYEYNKMGEKKEESEDRVSEDANYLSFKTLKSMRLHEVDADCGQTLMVLSRLDSHPACSQYFNQFINKKPPKKSLAMIGLGHFMLPQSLKENILFYSPMDQNEFQRILAITQLSSLSKQINSGIGLANEKYLRYSEWHQTRIEIARALFNNVDYLLLNRPCILEDMDLLKNIIEERRSKRKVTIIANNVHKYFFKLADKVLVLGNDAHEVGSYNQLSTNRLSLFNTMFLRHHQKVDNSNRIPEQYHDHLQGVMELPVGEEHSLELDSRTFFDFFSLIHRFAEFFIMVSLLAPLAVKAYTSYLIGLGLLDDIYLQYLIFGIVYLVLVFVRGVCISAYTNYASLSLYMKICHKNRHLNAHQILDIYQKPSIDFDFHIRAIDRNLVMDFEYAQSVLLEIVTASVVQFVVQPIFIALQVPVFITILYVSGFYGKQARAMYCLRRKQTRDIQKMINNCVARSQAISHYQKINEINSIFHMQNKIQIIYSCNHEWLQTSIRTLAELLIIIFFLVFLVIMIKTVPKQGTNTSIVGLGCGLFIGLMYLNTFFLKCFRQMEISLVSLTLCMDALRGQPNLSKLQIERMGGDKIMHIQTVEHITYKDVSLRYFKNICYNINLTIRGGDRIVMCGNSNSFKEMMFYILENSIFDRDEVQGTIIINDVEVTEFSIDKLYFLHANPIIPYIGNVTQALILDDQHLSPMKLEHMLEEFFIMLQIQPLFNGNSMVEQLTIEQKQIFEVFRAVKVEHCKVLIVVDGFDSIDMVSRRKLTRFLMSQSDINIIIETTNLAEIIKLYPRQLIFRNQQVTEQIRDPREAEVVRIDSIMQKLTKPSLNDLSKLEREKVIRKIDSKRK